MNKLIQELYHMAEEFGDNQDLYHREYFLSTQPFDALLDQVQTRCGADFCEDLYNAVLDRLSYEQYRAFHLGLRLGLQLHTL